MLAATPPYPSNRSTSTGLGGDGHWNFNKNIIIIPAVLYALICVLGLYSLIRFTLRWCQQLLFETTEATVAQLATTGSKKSDLRQIPMVVYGSSTNISTTECPICLVEFFEGEKVRLLPTCNHGFHVRCIDKWLSSHSSTRLAVIRSLIGMWSPSTLMLGNDRPRCMAVHRRQRQWPDEVR